MKQARFIQILDMQDTLYALDEEGRVWRYGADSPATFAWTPLSGKRSEEASGEPSPAVGFRINRSRKEK